MEVISYYRKDSSFIQESHEKMCSTISKPISATEKVRFYKNYYIALYLRDFLTCKNVHKYSAE
jgi:hypothetical protein